jgi:hypothetical protein
MSLVLTCDGGDQQYVVAVDKRSGRCPAHRSGRRIPIFGDERWRKRVPGEYSASLLHAAGRIYAFSHGGVTTVFQTDDAFQKLAENHLPGKLMATPAVVDRAMFLRTDTTLYRIEE